MTSDTSQNVGGPFMVYLIFIDLMCDCILPLTPSQRLETRVIENNNLSVVTVAAFLDNLSTRTYLCGWGSGSSICPSRRSDGRTPSTRAGGGGAIDGGRCGPRERRIGKGNARKKISERISRVFNAFYDSIKCLGDSSWENVLFKFRRFYINIESDAKIS